nr:unnamed protein product [Digitaria exilis]
MVSFCIPNSEDEALEKNFGSMSYDIVKATLISREILLEEVKKISNAIGYTLKDLDDTDLTLGKYETILPPSRQGTPTKCAPQMVGILRDFLEDT